MKRKAVLLPGDGIGPAISEAVTEILQAAKAPIEWETHHAGAAVAEEGGDPLPPSVVEAVRKTGLALKGPITTPVGRGFTSVNVRLRKELNLFAAVRPARSVPGVSTRYENVDVVVVRENTEGLYSGLEHEVVPGVVESLKIMTRVACERIARFAFEYARAQGRKRVTAIHKANIMKLADGLFLDLFEQVAKEFPDITADDCIVDAACMKMVVNPNQFDVVVMENLYGDILSDLCAGLVGGLGVTPGANLGQGCAVFEAVHGSAPDIAGSNRANPTALLHSATLMLDHIGEHQLSQRITQALHDTLTSGVKTQDLGGNASTTDFTQAIISRLSR